MCRQDRRAFWRFDLLSRGWRSEPDRGDFVLPNSSKAGHVWRSERSPYSSCGWLVAFHAAIEQPFPRQAGVRHDSTSPSAVIRDTSRHRR